ncbi:Uncharacterized protein APZ42_030724 [Daphnia magna]|uniref:Uncharacterized protein n=1 Tax=Daphnia magna TaxID=35525 RepID=A0A164NI57_9CRUS|nr:Uncharacterized protein APZ42_030724 [Daphnia magna]
MNKRATAYRFAQKCYLYTRDNVADIGIKPHPLPSYEVNKYDLFLSYVDFLSKSAEVASRIRHSTSVASAASCSIAA